MRLIIQPDYQSVSKWAAHYVAAKIKAANPTPEKPFVLGCPTGSSPLGMYKELIDLNKKGIISFSPLAQGMLTDRYLNGIPKDSRVNTDGRFLHADQFDEKRMASIRSLNEIAAARGESLAQMALKWVIREGVVTSVLIGASRPAQILENLKVLNSAPFTEEELEKIDQCALSL